jgi:hypothetical protein
MFVGVVIGRVDAAIHPLFCVSRIMSNCFLVLAREDATETKQNADVTKSHLFVMLHGLHGAGSDLHYLRDQLTNAVKGGSQRASSQHNRFQIGR